MSTRLALSVTGWTPETWLSRFRAAAPQRDPVFVGGEGPVVEAGYVAAWKAPEGVFARLRGLKGVISLGAGVDHLLSRPDLPHDIPIVRMIDPSLSRRMTEWVVFNVLFHLRQHSAYATRQAERRWAELAQPEAREIRVGIMGLGVLGRDAARALGAFGFQMRGWSRTRQTMTGVETFAGAEGLRPFLASTDVLVVLLPLTPQTDGLLDRPLFEALARDGALGGPILINGGRGGLQNEADLLAALGDGTLKAASLDVFRTEPLPRDSAFWGLSNCIITPHSAASSDPAFLVENTLAAIALLEQGKEPEGLVDRARGY